MSKKDYWQPLRIIGAVMGVLLWHIVLKSCPHPDSGTQVTAPLPPPLPTAPPPSAEDLVSIELRGALHFTQPTVSSQTSSDGEEAVCVVCMSSKRSHAFLPCGHMCVCGPCGQ